ncbi:MAG: glycerol dehydrogenase [Christensenellaceae bacterium]|nr:glycerol dehydrogenase [Christensenellaceae bacterium]
MRRAHVSAPVRAWGSPSRYIQGPNLLRDIEKYTRAYGKRVAAVIDQFFFDSLTRELGTCYADTGSAFTSVVFNSEVTLARIEATTESLRAFAPDVVVGIGGGKTLDTAKAVADNFSVPVVICPTLASTDAPTSALSVIYKDNGEHSHARNYLSNPNLVLMDSAIIAKAPIRFLVSGMGDALATVFEAKANELSDHGNYINEKQGPFRRPRTAMIVAEACDETLLEYGLQAKLAAERGLVTEAVEYIIECNTLMSGLGFENTGCAGAHSVGDGITGLKAGAKSLHGERVAFGVICQLVAEGAQTALIEEVVNFCLDVGLPVTLEDLSVEATSDNVRTIAEVSMNSFWNAEPFNVSVDQVIDIVLAGDAIGAHYKSLRG